MGATWTRSGWRIEAHDGRWYITDPAGREAGDFDKLHLADQWVERKVELADRWNLNARVAGLLLSFAVLGGVASCFGLALGRLDTLQLTVLCFATVAAGLVLAHFDRD